MIGDLLVSLLAIAVLIAAVYQIAYRRAEKRGNEALLSYARGAGDMISSFGHSLPDPRPLPDQIQDYLLAHAYTVTMTDTVGLAKRPDGSRAFTFNMKKPTFLPDIDWPAMLMTQIQYQLHKDKSGEHWSHSVIEIGRAHAHEGAGLSREMYPPEMTRTKPNQGLSR